MSKSAATAEQIALNLKWASESLADAIQYLEVARVTADAAGEESEHEEVFSNLKGAAVTLMLPLTMRVSDWHGFRDARRRRDDQIRDGIAEMTGK